MNPFYCKLNEYNSVHKTIINFINNDFETQENFEKEILNTFSLYFDEIPIELIQFISYFWNDDEYKDDEIFQNIITFIADNLESIMIDKICIYQVCNEIKEELENDENIVVLVEGLDKEHIIFRKFQNNGNYQLSKLEEKIYSFKDIEKKKIEMIKNHVIIIETALSKELQKRLNPPKDFINVVNNIENINENLFLDNKMIAFDKNILNFNKDVNTEFKYYELINPIKNTLNKSFLQVTENIKQHPELIDELKTKLKQLYEKLFKHTNTKKPAKLNYFCDFIIKNKFDYKIIEKNGDEPYLPFLLDLITAPYLIKSLNRNDNQYVDFFGIVNDKNLYTYLVKYFSFKYYTEENIIRNLLRFLYTEYNAFEKKFAKQKIKSIPFPPLNLTLNSYKFINSRMVVTKIA